MSYRIDHERIPGEELTNSRREPKSLMFCDEPKCYEFAQTSDPTAANTLLFKCATHAAEAEARGETGRRQGVVRRKWNVTTKEPGSRPRGRPARRVRCIDTGAEYESMSDAALRLRLTPSGVGSAIRTKRKCGGKRFEYVG